MMAVARDRRYTQDHPCPICNGHERLPRGTGRRCHGYLSDDDRWAHCSRQEQAGPLLISPESGTYAHRLVGDCRCGVRHDPLPAGEEPRPARPSGRHTPDRTHDYRDEDGLLVCQVLRRGQGPHKKITARRPDAAGAWVWNLDGVDRILYRLPELLGADPAATVFVVEGEACADILSERGAVATTNLGGAGKWREQYNLPLRSRHVVVLADNDDPGRRHAEQVAESLLDHAASVRLLLLPGLPEHGDVADWLAAGGTVEDLAVLAASAPPYAPAQPDPHTGGGTGGLPALDAQDGNLARASKLALAAIVAANDPPTLYRRDGQIVRVGADDLGYPTIVPLTVDALKHVLARCAAYYREGKTGREAAHPPMGVVRDVLVDPAPPLPTLARIIEAPQIDREGNLLQAAGYHPASRTLYVPEPGLVVPTVSAAPTGDEIARARDLIEETIGEFPFVGPADYAHAACLLLTPFVRPLIPGPTPLYFITKPSPGSGGTLLAEALTYPALGHQIAASTVPDSEDEWRKTLTARLLEGDRAILFDNVPIRTASHVFAAALTAPYWRDRRLGVSAMVRLPIECAWIVTGNNTRLSEELTRRAIRIRLEPPTARPWLRTGFTHPPLLGWVSRHRGELIWAALTLARAWIAAGRQVAPAAIQLGSYEAWSTVLGGILHTAGIGGFLENREELYANSDDESAVDEAFIAAWWARHGGATVGAADLWQLANDPEVGLDLGTGPERGQRTRLGDYLSRLDRRVVEVDGITARIERAGVRHHAQQWHLVAIGHQPG